MSAAIPLFEPPADLTLLDLVTAVCDIAADETEAVAIVQALLRSGRVRLAGNFRESHVAPLRGVSIR
jgi:hypothetical protein